MTRAALYLRRSTEEHQADSVEAQRELGRRFADARGLTVVAEHVDTASGAEWAPERRPGLYRLLASARAGELDVVVVRDDSRIGRDMLRAPLLLQDLADAGVEVLSYATGERLAVDTSTARLITTIRAYAAETERAAIASRTRDALERRARRGLVAGGACYGYRTERGPEGVRYVVEPAEAAVVVEVFEQIGRAHV